MWRRLKHSQRRKSVSWLARVTNQCKSITSWSTVKKAHFCSSCAYGLESVPHNGCHWTGPIPQNRNVAGKLDAMLDVSHSSAHQIIHDVFQFHKMSVEWVPKQITPELKKGAWTPTRNISEKEKRIMTRDGMWAQYYHSERKRASKELRHSNSPKPKSSSGYHLWGNWWWCHSGITRPRGPQSQELRTVVICDQPHGENIVGSPVQVPYCPCHSWDERGPSFWLTSSSLGHLGKSFPIWWGNAVHEWLCLSLSRGIQSSPKRWKSCSGDYVEKWQGCTETVHCTHIRVIQFNVSFR